tara:strand:- start:591 stop:1172 length:582 start_codon:yes stop_codon:yes gene_type:complete
MATIVLRESKGSPLSFAEADANFTNLNNDKQETIPNLGVVTSADMSADKISFYDTSAGATRSILFNKLTAFSERTLVVKCVADTIGPSVGNGITHVTIPSTLDGKSLQSAQAHVYTAGTGSLTTVQLHNLTDGQDMLSTPITIDSGEKDSSTAATPSVTGPYSGVSTADVIRIDVDIVATNTLGLEIRMVFNT